MAWLASLFLARSRPRDDISGWRAAAAGATGEPSKGSTSVTTAVFLTPQSIASFPVASLTVSALAAVGERVSIGISYDTTVVGLSLLVGLVIFLISIGDESVKPHGTREWLVSILIGFFNSLFIAGSVLGIPAALSRASR
jgi:hypothetical protein